MTAVAPELKSESKALSCALPLVSQDKQGIPWWLGLSYKGIGQYDLQDKLKPRKVSISSRLRTSHLTGGEFTPCTLTDGHQLWQARPRELRELCLETRLGSYINHLVNQTRRWNLLFLSHCFHLMG